ncbi:MAG: transglutaminase-like domain-containing protein [Myxococcales bacterium]|nr:transglutaminase-like domain-containing protein [Myxococcales bacterium]
MLVREFRKILLYVMMIVAFLALQLSEALSFATVVLFWLSLPFSWFWEEPRFNIARYARPWTVLTLGMFAFTVFNIFGLGAEVIDAGLIFVIFLAGAKLFQRAEDKDYTQAMALSLLLLAAAAVMNDDMSFGVLFAIYVVVSTLGLTVQHVNVEVTTFHRLAAAGMRIERAIVGATVVLGFSVFLGSAAFFFLFPRVGLGFFMQQGRDAIQTSGFGEEVSLGGHGTVREDSTVIMRVVFQSEPGILPEDIHWRGLSLDHYDGRRWRDTDNVEITYVHVEDEAAFVVAEEGLPAGGWPVLDHTTIQAEINLEPIGSDVLFGIGRLQAIQLPGTINTAPSALMGRSLSADRTGAVRLATRSEVGVRYIMHSLPNAVSEQQLRAALYRDEHTDMRPVVWSWITEVRGLAAMTPDQWPAQWTTEELILATSGSHGQSARRGSGARALASLYLQLPDGVITPRMAALNESLRAGTSNSYDYVVAVENWLRNELAYTTDLPEPSSPEANVVDEFLFEWQRGHCEYFATAMVILLRQQGVPARIVNGFLGADYNTVGRYFAVRQANAHSWVEVFFPGSGWVEFDPTPAGAASAAPRGMFAKVSEALDSLRLLWFRWVVEYDLEQQVSLLRDAFQAAVGEEDMNAGPRQSTWIAQRLRRLFFRLLSNLRAVSAMVLLAVGFTLAYRSRNLGRYPWSRTDWVMGSSWLGLSVLSGVLWWGEWPQAEALLVSVVPPVLGVWLAWLIRKAVLQPEESADARRTRGHLLVSHLYETLLRDVERASGVVAISLTMQDVLERLPVLQDDTRARLDRFVAMYRESRFGGIELTTAQAAALRRDFRQLRKLLARDFRAAARTALQAASGKGG